jgi:4a-hydroxytetrahydrobiopterin dehydratase
MKLREQKCEPCSSGTQPLSYVEARMLQMEIPEWMLKDNAIERDFQFKDFKEAIKFVNRMAEAAEDEGHHPDIHIYYNKVRVELSTHKIKGLSPNDFILAAKIDELAAAHVMSK